MAIEKERLPANGQGISVKFLKGRNRKLFLTEGNAKLLSPVRGLWMICGGGNRAWFH